MKSLSSALLIIAAQFYSSVVADSSSIAPIAFFHGGGDNCDKEAYWWGPICSAVGDAAPACKCVEIGNGGRDSFFMSLENQVASACNSLNTDPDFAGKQVNLIGISQGGMIVRSLVQTCHGLDVHTLFSYGSQQNGISGGLFHNQIPYKMGWFFHFAQVQKHFAPACYFRTWWDNDNYLENSICLPYLNNEKEDSFNQTYKDNLSNVTNAGFFYWTEDDINVPRETGWFSMYSSNGTLTDLRNLPLYQDDLIGLKTLDEAGKLFFYKGPGGHMHFEDYYVTDYLLPLLADETPTPSQY